MHIEFYLIWINVFGYVVQLNSVLNYHICTISWEPILRKLFWLQNERLLANN